LLNRTTYLDPNGVERTWESSERCTRPAGVDFDGVGIIAVLEKPGAPSELLLQKQYRPPIGKVGGAPYVSIISLVSGRLGLTTV